MAMLDSQMSSIPPRCNRVFSAIFNGISLFPPLGDDSLGLWCVYWWPSRDYWNSIVGEGTFYICWMVEFKFKCCVPLTMDLHYSPEICSLLHDTKDDPSALMASNYHLMVITGLKWTVGQWLLMFWNDKWLIMNGYLVAIPWLQLWLIIEKTVI